MGVCCEPPSNRKGQQQGQPKSKENHPSVEDRLHKTSITKSLSRLRHTLPERFWEGQRPRLHNNRREQRVNHDFVPPSHPNALTAEPAA